VVTSQEVSNGAASLSQFKAILPLNGVDANLTSYKAGGGTLLTEPEQLTQYTTAYAQIDAPDVGVLQTVPAVATSGTSASITLANITSGTVYDDPIAVSHLRLRSAGALAGLPARGYVQARCRLPRRVVIASSQSVCTCADCLAS
jgi:hypothetical protein